MVKKYVQACALSTVKVLDLGRYFEFKNGSTPDGPSLVLLAVLIFGFVALRPTGLQSGYSSSTQNNRQSHWALDHLHVFVHCFRHVVYVMLSFMFYVVLSF